MNTNDDHKLHPILAVLFALFLMAFFGGGLLLFINLFVPFLTEGVFAMIAIGVGAVFVVGAIAGKCFEVITTLRAVTKTGSSADSDPADEQRQIEDH